MECVAAGMGVCADGSQQLLLDSALRDWVLLPITLVMVLVGVLRNNVMRLLDSPPKRAKLAVLRQQCVPRGARSRG